MNNGENLAVLVGNGLSIAFNPELKLDSITKEVVDRIKKSSDNGEGVMQAMNKIVKKVERVKSVNEGPNRDFEALVGAFGSESESLSYLKELAEVTSEDDAVKNSLQDSIKFVEKIRDNGISHVLEVIFERSRASVDKTENLRNFVQSIYKKFPGKIVFSNLNYDTLLLSALLNMRTGELVDMGDGRYKPTLKENLLGVPKEVTCNLLRKDLSDFNDLKDRKLCLLHLHGSLTYWRSTKGSSRSNSGETEHYKLGTETLAELKPWELMRSGDLRIRPDVVLANPYDKTEHVGRHPFSLCYQKFGESLEGSDNWLIVGYSFRDEPVNSRLRKEFLNRKEKPNVMVVTYGTEPSNELIERSLGWGKEDDQGASSEAWLTIDRGGANGMETRQEWGRFCSHPR